ncbi:C45 family autoproteolytic acyltransferase/hydolase [Adlercreutzia sp.]|uniref:C45 family autoproteolytic acyltransferase/hydolase n=1 Tax=Adlercreutzia sp. TaxID=1872387 RepID=UPI003A8479D2
MVTQEQQSIIDHAQLQKINGWQHIKVKGTPYECGFQEGYLLADEYQDALRVYKFMTLETFGMTYEWFAEQALKLHCDKIPTRWLEELRGMAEGLTAAGIPTTTDDMIAWNDWMEITGYWWPQNAGKIMSRPLMKTHRKEHCSAIVATGSATVDGKPYLGHESFDEFWSGQYFNICKRVEPDDGYAFIMQASAPCMLSSMTDFYVTAAGLNITETTLAGFDRYDDAGMPEWVRIRDAVQYAATIDEFVERLNKGNNGGYANAWLIAGHNTGEIARFEQGLEFTSLERTFDGAYFGCNAVFDPRIRNLECKDNGFNDPRQQTGARRQRWMELIDQYYGKIDLEVVKKMLADTYDVYLGYNCPSSRDICAHYDVDPQYYADDPDAVWNIPFYPAGSCDAKAAGPDDVKHLKMWGRYGRADGVEFVAKDFMDQHPLWKWMDGYLEDRPTQPWTLFD